MTVRTSFYLTSYVIKGPIQMIGMVAKPGYTINIPLHPTNKFAKATMLSTFKCDYRFQFSHQTQTRSSYTSYAITPKPSNNQTEHSNDMAIFMILEPTFALQQYPIIFGIEPQLQLLPCLRSNKTNGSSEGVISLFHASIIV